MSKVGISEVTDGVPVEEEPFGAAPSGDADLERELPSPASRAFAPFPLPPTLVPKPELGDENRDPFPEVEGARSPIVSGLNGGEANCGEAGNRGDDSPRSPVLPLPTDSPFP